MTATIGIVGSGAVGRALAAHIVASGQNVVLCNSRGPATLERLVEELGPRASALETSAVAAADLVVFAIPWPAVVPLLEELPPWHGRILIDDIRYAAVDLGSLSTGSALQQPGGPLADRDLWFADDALAE